MTAQEAKREMVETTSQPPIGCSLEDWEDYREWYRLRELVPPAAGLCPPFAFIRVRHAAGWVLTTDADLCIFEGICADPRISSEERWVDLLELAEKLRLYSALQGKSRLVCLPSQGRLERVCEAFGMERIGEHVMYGERIGGGR